MLLPLFIAALWSPAGKGMTSWLLLVIFNCVFVTLPSGILVQVWYLIVSILDLCRLLNFERSQKKDFKNILCQKFSASGPWHHQSV